MRRSEREMTDTGFMHQVLRDAEVLYIAINAEGAPYVLAVNFVLFGDDIYFHCATEGRKVDLMRGDPRIGFTAAVDIAVEGTTTRYRSVCGTGIAEPVTDPDRKVDVLKALAARFSAPCFFPVSERKLASTTVVRIAIATLTGKYSRRGEGPRPVPHYER